MLSTFPPRAALIGAALVLFCLIAAPAHAQLEKRFAVGVSVATFQPTDEELDTKVGITPTISRVPRRGLGVALALNWVNADVNGSFVGVNDRLATLNVRPFMAGVGYTFMNGPLSITPSVVVGPSWNRLEIDEDFESFFSVSKEGDEDFGRRADAITLAVRPGLSATYAVHPRFGITGFAGYLFNRPKFDVQPLLGTATRTPWKADGLTLSVGVVVPVF